MAKGWENKLCFGDNLDILRKSIADESQSSEAFITSMTSCNG